MLRYDVMDVSLHAPALKSMPLARRQFDCQDLMYAVVLQSNFMLKREVVKTFMNALAFASSRPILHLKVKHPYPQRFSPTHQHLKTP